jgi:hypothetical protein
MFFDRADRVLALGVGADAYPIGKKSMTLSWTIQPGETRTGWVIRPYEAYEADLPALRTSHWEAALAEARQCWCDLLGRAMVIDIPDPAVREAFYACLADVFVMREPLGRGYTGAVPGTEVYRAANPFEGTLASLALDQAGLHAEAAEGLRLYLETQEPSGEWADDRGWTHHMWGASGFKAWTALEHYRLTGDLRFLEQVYPRLAASARWQEGQRSRSRILREGARPVTYGLMPRGMGDCGLMDGDDVVGIFYPHNILAVFADRLAVEAARILTRDADLPELERIYETGRADLLASLDQGAIQEEGYRWIPGVPNKITGSRWGALYACTPASLLPPDHDLIEGTLHHIETHMSPGGHPIHTGWMPDGCWIAISLDNFAETHLARGDGEAACRYLYATLNHATPLITWCEERGTEPATPLTSGDRQHLFTPVAVVRFMRDALVLEKEGGLVLAAGASPAWLASGQPVGVRNAPTHSGPVSYRVVYDPKTRSVAGSVELQERTSPPRIDLYIRLPGNRRVVEVEGAERMDSGEGVYWKAPHGKLRFTGRVESH